MLDGHGLIGDQCRFDPDRQVRRDLCHRLRDVMPERQDVSALAHGDREPDALSSVDAEHRLRRVGGAARHAGDVAQANDPAAGDEVDGEDVLFRPECARDADKNLFVARLHHARRRDGVLGAEGRDQRRAVDLEARQLLGGELHVDALVLSSEDIDLRNVRQLEELLADVFHVIAQLPVRESVSREAVHDAVRVAKLVIEAGADDALRQGMADVANLLADLVPDVRHLSRRGRVLEIDEDRGLPCRRVALQVIQVRRLLELALEPVGDLLERVADRGARPTRLDHHGLDGEIRILAPPEPDIGADSRDDDGEHEIGDHGAVPDRPFREIEAFHHTPPRIRTF